MKERVLEASDGKTYKITVEYDTTCGIPADAELQVSELVEGSEEYKAFIEKTAETLGKDIIQFAFAHAFDIKLVNPKTGEPYQPNKSVKVTVEMMTEELSADDDVSVVHFTGDIDRESIQESGSYIDKLSGESTEVLEVDVVDGAVEFETNSFSVFVLAYTVDFTYDGFTYNLAGGDEMLLSELFDILSIDADLIGSDAEFSDDMPEGLVELTAIEENGTVSDWRIKSLAPFSTEHELIVKLANGNNYVIGVTDEVEITPPTVIDNLAYTGEAQELVAPGSTNEGTLYYALGVDEENEPAPNTGDVTNWYESVPTGTDAGTYYVWYKVDNYANASYVQATIAPKNIKVTVGNLAGQTYNGSAVDLSSVSMTTDEDGLTATGTVVAMQNDVVISPVDVGSYDLTVSTSGEGALVLNSGDDVVTRNYDVTVNSGTLSIKPAPVTLTAISGNEEYTGEEINLGYTCSVDGLDFDGVSVTSASDYGMHEVTFDGVTIGETKDTTGNYVVTGTKKGLLIIRGKSPLIEKTKTNFKGNLAYYTIVVNPDNLTLTEDGQSYILQDNFSNNPGAEKEWSYQSINYGSIEAVCETSVGEEVTWDYSGYTGTFSIPDSTCVTITYYTRVKGEAGEEVPITNTAELGKTIDKSFISAASDSVSETVTIDPDISGSGGVYTIDLFVYAQDSMQEGLGGAEFRLLDSNMQPMTYKAGTKAGKEITFTTASETNEQEGTRKGYVTIKLDEETDGLKLRKNTVYYLEMVTAPYTVDGSTYTYYQKDNTYYSFLITDDPSYEYGGVYSYYNGDVLKVRCYSENSVVFESGKIENCNAASGAGFYKSGGSLTIKNASVQNCTASEDGGGIYSEDGAVNLYATTDSGKIYHCSAKNGGGIYIVQNTLNLGESGKTSKGLISNCTATQNGGGLFIQNTDETNVRNTSEITDCEAGLSGGGVYQRAGNVVVSDSATITNCVAKSGETYSTANLGGGIYKSDGAFCLYGSNSRIDTCKAYDGGGIYNASGSVNLGGENQYGGSIIKCDAQNQGGGVCQASGSGLNISGSIIGGSRTNANYAGKGAGVFVADGAEAHFNNYGNLNPEITYNHARVEGGGIAVGGSTAKLNFENKFIVQYNTMGSNNATCNVYLDVNSNAVIQNKAIAEASYIGVYASDSQEQDHGITGKPFATWSTDDGNKNLSRYFNDRRPLCGTVGSGNLVVWQEFICKITDASGTILCLDPGYTLPAVYTKLENNGEANTSSAYGMLQNESTQLYDKNGPYSGSYQIQMLVPEYETVEPLGTVSGSQLKTITITTADTAPDEFGFRYTGTPKQPYATITRGEAVTDNWITTYDNLTLTNVIFDGEGVEECDSAVNVKGGSFTIGANATIKNVSSTGNGGAIRLDGESTSVVLNGGTIENCSAGGNGGAVCLSGNNAVFDMIDGAIKGCSSTLEGGAVYIKNVNGSIYMRGGTITGCSARVSGGAIAVEGGENITVTSKLYFGKNGNNSASGICTVLGNTANSARSNVELKWDSNDIINASDLNAKSEIGIFVPGNPSNYSPDDQYGKHGRVGAAFGSRNVDLPDDKLYCFVNDQEPSQRGFRLENNNEDGYIYWQGHPLLRVRKTVVSDWSEDRTADFKFEIKLTGTSVNITKPTKYGEITFKPGFTDGVITAELTLKDDESKTAVLPDDFLLSDTSYEVTEVFLTTEQESDYTTVAKEARHDPVTEGRTVSGKLGENIDGSDNSTSLSEIQFTNSRVTGEITIGKVVDSKDLNDYNDLFQFTMTLDDSSINKYYEAVDQDNRPIEDGIRFTNGRATFYLKNNETITIKDLPTDLPYAVEEVLTDTQRAKVRTQVEKDDSGKAVAVRQEGKVGDHVTAEGKYSSTIVFTNYFLEFVCKIMNRSRNLLYYRDGHGVPQPAVFSHLEDAFDQVNSGNLRTSTNGNVTGILRIEMIVPEYTMERTATLSSGKTVLLTTASKEDQDEFPYDPGTSNIEKAIVYRGFTDGSMILDRGVLTLDKIVLDGACDADTPVTGEANGGIIQVGNSVKLTVNKDAVLQNSTVYRAEGANYQGGAIWLSSGATLAMNGTITNCSAASGGGVYADTGFGSITTTGSITGCEAKAGNGGAICASSGQGAVINLNTGTELLGNSAKKNTEETDGSTGNGGAVYSDANVILRGTVSGTGNDEDHSADNNGGGIYMGSDTTYTMYAGSTISGNTAANGGGLFTRGTSRIAGGSFEKNKATGDGGGLGGAVYAAESAVVTISGSSSFTENEAEQGGALYDQGSVSMTSGSMAGNIASAKGGAVHVAGGKSYTMSGGTISEGNKSPEGAVSTGENAELNFSGNAVVTGNTGSDGTTAMNVYLGYNSNDIIKTSGLGRNANIGVYVADGDPETTDTSDPEYRKDRVDNPIYCDHGLGGRNFGTYTGSNIDGARLNKFINDRDPVLNGMPGTEANSIQYIAWKGKGLELEVTQYLIKTDREGNPVLDGNGNKVLYDTVVPVQNASFTFERVNGDTTVQVWSGKSNSEGIVSIPWGSNETSGGNVASFVPGSVYVLKQTVTDGNAVLPGGNWKATIGRNNSVNWVAQQTDDVDRTLDILMPEKAFLGETFGLKNDIKPTLTFDVNAKNSSAKLSDNSKEKTEVIPFTTTQTSHEYTIKETNPTWDSHVFKAWATMEEKPKGENGAELTGEALSSQGYYEFTQNSEITFYRGTDSADPAVKYTDKSSKGNMTLYAQWDEVVCKITDRSGTLLYIDGVPAVYGTLEDGFDVYNTATSLTFKYSDGSKATARRIEMLVGEYTLDNQLTLVRGKTVMLTTAPSTDTDGYAYTGTESVCVITRGGCDSSMIENHANLTLMNITLDGNHTTEAGTINDAVVCDGGIVSNIQNSAVLTVSSGTTLRNSKVDGNGGAVYGYDDTKLKGTEGNFVSKAFNDTDFKAGAKNGGMDYPKDELNNSNRLVRQDIYLDGTAGEGQALTSITLTGNLTDTVPAGSIWIWAAGTDNTQPNHYYMHKQFAVLADTFTDPVEDATYNAFRNARADADTDCGGDDYLTGQSGDNIGNKRCVYWSGVEGSAHVMLVKVRQDGTSYKAWSDKTFYVYTDSAMTKLAKGMIFNADGTVNDKFVLNNLTSGAGGAFFIGELPYGKYYVKEDDVNGKHFEFAVTGSGVITIEDYDAKTEEPPAQKIIELKNNE